ncbi:MAG: putative lipid II flippase FtsW [Coriobacteriia bacterium]|nr:putative lipid II flippase FtsW [Coriobacteriia bacterium]
MSNRSAMQGASSTPGQGVASSIVIARIGFLIIVAILLVFGLIMLYSASSIYSYNLSGDYTSVFYRQTIFVAIGVVVALAIALIPYKQYSLPVCAIALLITIPLLILVLTDGSDALGARRWIDLGFTTLQPSEFTKIALILVMAHLVDRCRTNGYSVALIVVMIIACIIPIGLIVVEPDLGTTIIAVVGILAVLWFGGVPKRIVGALAIGLVVLAVIAIVGSGFRQSRITAWLDPWSDPQGSGYQLINSYYAFGGGGVLGVGLGLSKQKFSWLPQSENDFLYAIVGEELGLLGAFAVALLFVGLIIMALRIARDAPDAYGAMIVGASGVAIGFQAFLNMLCVVGALPITGKPLPFFSAGGTSIISTMILVGLILSVSLQSSSSNVHDFRREQFAVVSGGRRLGSSSGSQKLALPALPNPAALVGALLSKQPAQSQGRRERPAAVAQTNSRSNARPIGRNNERPLEGMPRTGRTLDSKVIPISRGRADRATREKHEQRKQHEVRTSNASSERSNAPVSMSSLRRNRVRRELDEDRSTGGRSA